MIKRCKQCGKEFNLTESEMKFYEDKGLSLPKRCKSCRLENKKESSKETTQLVNNKKDDNHRSVKQNKKKHPLMILLAMIIAVLGFIFNGPTFFLNHQDQSISNKEYVNYQFRNDTYLEDHFKKHKAEFNYSTASEYLEGANRVLQNPNVLHKIESEDGDDVYYLEATNELVVISKDGYIRTYFKPSDGLDYFDRQ